MTNMSPKMIEARKRWFLEGVLIEAHTNERLSHPNRRSRYEQGQIRCTNCLKWINPRDPKDAAQIHLGKGGRRLHRNCPVNSPYPSQFMTTSKFHGTRRKRYESIKRY